jgi:hypothetical protein
LLAAVARLFPNLCPAKLSQQVGMPAAEKRALPVLLIDQEQHVQDHLGHRLDVRRCPCVAHDPWPLPLD